MKYTVLINQYAAVTNGLNLDLIDLAIFDFIKDFANSSSCVKMQTPEGVYFWISHKLVLEAMPLLNIKTNQGLIKRIDNLINAGILRKHPNCDKYRQTLYSFGENYDLLAFANMDLQPTTKVDNPQQKLMATLNESLGITLNESLGYNINNTDNTNNDNNIAPQIDFAAPVPVIEQPEESKDKKTLFRNSEIYKLVKFDETGAGVDYSEFEKKFATPEFETVDLVYYFHAVADWSDQKNMKRTKNGWLATVRNFIRGDVERNKLHLKPQFQQSKSKINVSDAVKFLNDDF
jgi:hypothetical protein